jgi:hypothetical protein
MKTDFTIQPWQFSDTTARVTCNTPKARERMDNALSVDVRLSELIGFVSRLAQQGFKTNCLDNSVVVPDADWGKEHRVKLDNGVVTSYPRDQMQQATQYMMSLIAQGIAFSYEFKM